MNNFTIEEQKVFDRVKKPLFTFDDVQKALDKHARKLGFENHLDFLAKTGWANRFDNDIN